MARHRNIRAIVRPENLIQHRATPHILIYLRLRPQRLPQQILLRKSLLKHESREARSNACFAAASITGVAADTLAEELFDDGNEGVARRKGEVGEGEERGGEAAGQRAGVVALGCWGFLNGELGGPEVVCDQGLGCAGRSEAGIGPGDGAVAVEEGPVALWSLLACLDC